MVAAFRITSTGTSSLGGQSPTLCNHSVFVAPCGPDALMKPTMDFSIAALVLLPRSLAAAFFLLALFPVAFFFLLAARFFVVFFGDADTVPAPNE